MDIQYVCIYMSTLGIVYVCTAMYYVCVLCKYV